MIVDENEDGLKKCLRDGFTVDKIIMKYARDFLDEISYDRSLRSPVPAQGTFLVVGSQPSAATFVMVMVVAA